MDHIMGNLQSLWINPELYPRYINEAFIIITDIDIIEALYREGELGYFFNTLIIDRFRTAIEYDTSNWNLIVNNMRGGQTGRIVTELRERNIMASDVYRENIIRIGRLNPNNTRSIPDRIRNDLSFGGVRRKNKKNTTRKKKRAGSFLGKKVLKPIRKLVNPSHYSSEPQVDHTKDYPTPDAKYNIPPPQPLITN